MGCSDDAYVPSQKLPRPGRVSGPPTQILMSHESLPSARVFLGLAQGGIFPGVTYYLSMWYKRSEQSRRVAIFFSAATVAGASGGLLAYGIEKLDGTAGLHGWAWIVSS
jgi:MFS family permease